MTSFRPFQPLDTPWTLAGLGFGLVYDFLGILCLALILFENGWVLLLFGAPFLLVQIAFIFGFGRFLKWRDRHAPPPPPTSWLRHHSISIGAVVGGTTALALRVLNGPLLGTTQ